MTIILSISFIEKYIMKNKEVTDDVNADALEAQNKAAA